MRKTKLATRKTELASNGSIHASIERRAAEIRFLEYRLEVVQSWPDSSRKLATLEGILLRLLGNRAKAN